MAEYVEAVVPRGLLRRAEGFLRERGAACPAEEVARHVFGVAGPVGAAWLACLRAALTEEEGFAWGDGDVGLRAWATAGRELRRADLVVLGFCPVRRRRPPQVVALSVGEQGVGDVFARHLEPPPGFVGHWDEPLEEWGVAPTAEVAAAVGEACQGADLAVVADAAALRRLLPEVHAPRLLDLTHLAALALPAAGRPDLRSAARALGLRLPTRDDALSRAWLSLATFTHLAEHCEQQGLATLADLDRALGDQAAARARGQAALLRARLGPLAGGSGAYVMRDAAGEALYVGKARQVERRLAAYASLAHNATRRLEGLLGRVEQVEVVPTESEEEALDLEGWLIQQLRPRYNVQRRRRTARRYVALDQRPAYPELRACTGPAHDGRLFVGPLAPSAECLLRDVKRKYRLHTCTRALPGAGATAIPCYRAAIGLCQAPCAGQVLPEQYRAASRAAFQELLERAAARG